MQSNELKFRRVAAGEYVSEKGTVYQRNEREIYTVCYQRHSGVYTRRNRDWAFSVGNGESFRGYGSKKQAVDAMVKFLAARNLI